MALVGLGYTLGSRAPGPGAVARWTRRGGILLESLKNRARQLKAETYALYLAARHPDTPWFAKLLAAAVAAYALSPIDLIPDFVPVIGYLDDLVIVPAGIAVAVRMVPEHVLVECRVKAGEALKSSRLAGRQ